MRPNLKAAVRPVGSLDSSAGYFVDSEGIQAFRHGPVERAVEGAEGAPSRRRALREAWTTLDTNSGFAMTTASADWEGEPCV